ncbi:Cobalamin synthase [hydrothermal vent metagenome]|uniref:Adenosylcobinamide-GDP ribazoletransferase n=1 Tax=hydrothermal vent metagenome TaxID=652676 RepID=A0A3B0ZZM4_9ZZZZ
MITALRLAFQFLTRIPISTPIEITLEQQSKSLLFYPLVGLFIGTVLLSVLYIVNPISNIIAAALTLTIWVLITGGLHIDGLADSADAWLGGTKATKEHTKSRTFEIMKDPNCGPAGVFWIVLIMLVKFAALTEVTQSTLFIVLLVPTIGRTMAILLFITTPYVSPNGIASEYAKYIPQKALIVIIFFVALFLVFINIYSVLVIFTSVLAMILLRQLMLSRLDGMTGDTAGALIEITECVSLVTYILIFSVTVH